MEMENIIKYPRFSNDTVCEFLNKVQKRREGDSITEITYVIMDELGLHARPAGQLVKLCSTFACSISIGTPEKMVNAKRIFGVMGLALKQGTKCTMTFDGPDEVAAAQQAEAFMQENL